MRTTLDMMRVALLTAMLALGLALPAAQAQNPAPLLAGENFVGAVGGQTAIVGGTLTKSTKTTAYAAGQLITQGVAGSSSPIVVTAARAIDKTGMIRRARLKVNDASWLGATIRIHVFKDAPSFTNGDGGAFAAGLSESNHICAIDVTLDLSFAGPVSKGVGVPAVGSECNFDPSSGTRNLSLVLEARSITAGGHSASSTFTAVLEVLQN